MKKRKVGRPKMALKSLKWPFPLRLRLSLIKQITAYCRENNLNKGQFVESLIVDGFTTVSLLDNYDNKNTSPKPDPFE